MTFIRKFGRFLVLALCALPLAACEPADPDAKVIPTLTALAVTPTTATVNAGQVQQVTVAGVYSDGTRESLTSLVGYTSSNTSVATVSSAGVVTGVGGGTATITARDAASGVTSTMTVTVPPPTPLSMTISPPAATLAVATTQQLAPVGTFAGGGSGVITSVITSGVTYVSSNTAVATVSNTGLVTAVSVGSSTITATHGPTGLTATAAITVSSSVSSYTILDFNTSGLTYTLTPFGGEAAELTSAGVPPGGPAGQVAKLTRAAGADCFAGTTMSIGAQFSVGRLPFSSTAKQVTVRIYAPATGMSIKLKVENANDAGISVETDVVTAVVGWQTLTFDFSVQSPGTAALNPANTYNKITIFPNFSCPAGGPTVDEVFFVGPLTFIGASAPSAPPLGGGGGGSSSYTILDFKTPGLTYTLTPFGGDAAELTSTGVPSGGATGQVAKITRTAGSQCFAGTTMSVGDSFSVGRLPFSSTAKQVTVQLWAPAAGQSVKLKVENANDAAISVETDQLTTAAGWQTLTFDFSAQSPGTAALNTASTYNKITIFPVFTCGGADVTTEQIYYVGDITFLGASAPSAPPLGAGGGGGGAGSYVVLDFNTSGVNYTLTPFGGLGAELTNIGVPTGGPTDLVAKLIRPVTAECFAGSTLSVGGNFSIGTLPFSSTAKTMTVLFYSPVAGPSIKLKVENANDPTVSVETDEPAAAGWQTLTFDFAAQSPGTAALNTASTYNKVTIFPAFNCGGTAPTTDLTFYVGPVTFIGAGAPSAPPLP